MRRLNNFLNVELLKAIRSLLLLQHCWAFAYLRMLQSKLSPVKTKMALV